MVGRAAQRYTIMLGPLRSDTNVALMLADS
jgi:hypothetical protein